MPGSPAPRRAGSANARNASSLCLELRRACTPKVGQTLLVGRRRRCSGDREREEKGSLLEEGSPSNLSADSQFGSAAPHGLYRQRLAMVTRDGTWSPLVVGPGKRMALIRHKNPDLQAAARPGQEQKKARAHDPSARSLARWESEGGATGRAPLHIRDTDVTPKSTDSGPVRFGRH